MSSEKLEQTVPDIPIVIPPVLTETSNYINPPAERICPLCKSDVRLFFINFNYKMLMCENTKCEFPFGYEDLQFVKENNFETCDSKLDSKSIKKYNTPAVSNVTGSTSGSGTEKINRLNTACISEDSQLSELQALDVEEYINIQPLQELPKLTKTLKSFKKHKDLVTNMNDCVIQLRGKEKTCIKNEDTLKELYELQESSKTQLLSPLEMCLLKTKHIVPSKKEETVKLDIKTDGPNMIHVEIALDTDQ